MRYAVAATAKQGTIGPVIEVFVVNARSAKNAAKQGKIFARKTWPASPGGYSWHRGYAAAIEDKPRARR